MSPTDTPSTSADPAGTMGKAIALVRRLAEAPQGDLIPLKQAARAWLSDYEHTQTELHAQQRRRLVPDKSVDGWILSMFSATESAISREQLLRDFIDRYRTERRVVDHARHGGPWLFELVQPVAGEGLELERAHGAHPQAMAEYAQRWLPQWRQDPYLHAVFADKADVDAWHPLWFGQSPLFSAALDVAGRLKGEPDYWVNAVALPGGARQSQRGLFIVHPNGGSLEDPRPPPGMKQDQRLLLVLSLAWRQLEHQIKALATLSELERRQMIQLLAPGLLHHEIGAAMAHLSVQARALQGHLGQLASANPQHAVLARLEGEAADIVSASKRLYSITDAFNNLDKRSEVEETDLHRVCEALRVLLRHRLGAQGVDLRWAEASFAQCKLHTDAVLLTQALLNLLNNALNAFAEHDVPPPRRLRIELLSDGGHDTAAVQLQVINNGPAVETQDIPYLFKRGFTTRQQGHGQGLYLARLIATYLGGELRLMERSALPDGYHVGFRLTISRLLPARQGVGRALL